MVMTWRPARMRPLRSRALPSASQTGRCKTSMTGEKPVWERNSDPPMRSCAHEQRQRARRSSSFLRPVGQRRLRGLDEDGMGTAQQRAMQADALIHGCCADGCTNALRRSFAVPWSGNSCPLFASPLGGHLTTEDQSRPLTSIRVNVFSSSKRNFDFQVAFAE